MTIALLQLPGCTSDAATPGEDGPQQIETPQSEPHGSSSGISTESPSLTVVPAFADVAAAVGIDFSFYSDAVPERYFLPEVMGGGAAWSDFDNEGTLDLYLMNGCVLDPATNSGAVHRNRLYRGTPGGLAFRQAPHSCGGEDEGYGQGCAAGDFDTDGFVDLYLANFGANVLLMNNGDGTFSDVTSSAGVEDETWSSSVVWLDADSDNDLDLYVTNYLDVHLDNNKVCEYSGNPGYCGPGQYEPVPDRLFLNQSDGTFVEASRELGIIDDIGKGLAVAVVDFNDDLVPEIYVANDMTPNFLFVRDETESGGVRYVEMAAVAGCAQSGDGMNEASMGIACLDYDGDQRVDIFLTHYYHMKNTVYRNHGDLLFDDVSLRVGMGECSYHTIGFGTAAFDFDRDGFDDLFKANGHVLGPENEPFKLVPQLLHNEGGRRFVDVADQAGDYFLQKWLGRGVAYADFDDDGDMDLLVTHLDEPVALLRNDTPASGHYLGLQLETPARLPPIGARVRVTCGMVEFVKTRIAGGSYLCDSDQRLLFPLPDEAVKSVGVEVSWPSGSVQKFELEVDRYWQITEGCFPRVCER